MVHSITESHALDISIYVLIMILLSWVPSFRPGEVNARLVGQEPLGLSGPLEEGVWVWSPEPGPNWPVPSIFPEVHLCEHTGLGGPTSALPPSCLTAVCFVQKRARWLLSVPGLGQGCSMGMASGALTAAPCLITGGHWCCWLGQD